MKNETKKTKYNTFNLWRRDESERFTRRLAWYCACRSGRFADDLCNYVADKNIQEICTYSIDYRVDDDPLSLAYARQCLAFFAKNTDVVIKGVDRTRNAELSFAETERKCRITNQRFSLLYRTEQLLFCEDGLVFDVSRKISEILGDCPRLEDLDLRFGPGLNVGCTGANNTSVRHKLNAPITHSSDILDELLEEFRQELPHMFKINKLARAVAKLSWVSKNWRIYRSIIIECLLNGLGQLGVGSWLKARFLKVAGVDLTDQYRNRHKAYLGSLHGGYATIDIKNASNTLALMVVFHLVQSEDWFSLLNQLRTSTVKYKDKVIDLEMFSSMGNGFTFELESIIFYAIAYVTVLKAGGDTLAVSVFGDDLIVPSDPAIVSQLYHNLEFFGFEVNSEKSYTSGPFRESCGADYFNGSNIRPFYLKDRWTDARLIGLLNFDLGNWRLFDDIRLELETLVFKKSNNIVSFGPPGFGDGHLHYDVYDPQHRMHLRRNKDSSGRVETAWQAKKLEYEGMRRKHRKLSAGSVKPRYSFKTIVKVPMTDTNELELGDQLYPLWSAYRLRSKAKPSYKIVYDSVASTKTRIYVNVPEKNGKQLENDPYVLRGGWKTKVVKVDLEPTYEEVLYPS
jgi:hypothetical protein